jgi:nitric oxide reductase NorE protein
MESIAPALPLPAEDAPRLRGDLAVWLVILIELSTFALMFASFAFARIWEPQVFEQSQATLDLRFGAINTMLLVTGSAGVARAVQALRAGAERVAGRWWLVALACGLGFLALKLVEYAAKFEAGVGLGTNTFYMFYILLTGFHFLHVLAAVVFIVVLWVQTRRGAYGPQRTHVPETGAAFWHMVDLLWIVLFPLVYVMR